jgi:hypothetical protein
MLSGACAILFDAPQDPTKAKQTNKIMRFI